MFHSPSLTHLLSHQLRTTASCLWLTVIPQRTLVGAVTRLSYPEAPNFLGCQPRQVSPCGPRASLHAHQPTCAANVAPFRYAPSAGLTRFRTRPGHTGITSRAPFHGRPTSSVLIVNRHMPDTDWVEEGGCTLQRPA